MRKLILAAIAAGAALATVSPAEARDGCGRGFHRGPAGFCRPNVRPVIVAPVVAAPVLRIGVFYPRRGYWTGRRYYWNRYRWRGGWRYR